MLLRACGPTGWYDGRVAKGTCMFHPRTSALLLFLLVALGVASCAQEEAPLLLQPGSDAGADASLGQVGPQGVRVCTQAHSESLPARLVAMSANAQSSGTVVLVSDLFQRFNDTCKPCHTAAADIGQGGFQITTVADFTTKMTGAILAHVTGAKCPSSEDPTNPDDPMPPCDSPTGETYGDRPETDPIRQFAELVTAWLKAGSPESFTTGGSSADAGADAGTANPYALTPVDGNAMTNIGNCVPSPAMIAIEDTKSKALDAMFAGLQAKPSGATAAEILGLPEHLSETDLTTLDSATLAQYGVVAYAPGYPLWSDNAGKLRYVRVPRGQSIHFNKTTQQFEIPPNTRFYKTFMKQIADTDGSYRYRKIETRLIVSRPDQNNADGTAAAQTALFGSYQWNADESDATLVETPLNSGEPFSDTLLFYHTDEQLAADVLSANPADSEGALLEANAARHYAIPSSVRCVQCHMGSPSQAFVLGFTPLQINRRPTGSGGTIEATGSDELTQLQRFIDAGILTGIDSPSDILPLEQSQGSRAPRNGAELTAQGYMLGNCAHCHNPRGFPTIQNPVLQGVLDFLPSTAGGIFQFPLERMSPRVGRGSSGTNPIPYITPSLVDYPPQVSNGGASDIDQFANGAGGLAIFVAYAPWRSLIYRNVDNAFAYTYDNTIFPHMPFNTPGYDPRAKEIVSDWMVSIPAVLKDPEYAEYSYQTSAGTIGGPADPTPQPQPYVEVPPGGAGYADAVRAAQQRLFVLHTGENSAVPLDPGGAGFTASRYGDPGETDDILDPSVVANPVCQPIPQSVTHTSRTQVTIPVPDHPHWVNTDLTSPPGPWTPRQSNWPTVLAEQLIPPLDTGADGTCSLASGREAAYADETDAVGLLQTAALDQVEAFSTALEPFGLWQQTPGCDFSSQPTVQSFTPSTSPPRPHWMDYVSPAPGAPVFQQTPGAAVFKMICINCHGPKADSNGRLAQNLATMTGGNALVADFRDGLFGPVGAAPDASNRAAQYGLSTLEAADAGPTTLTSWSQAPDGTPLTYDDRAARYMAWMGLGGTSVNIPVEILDIVAITKVLDQQRVLSSAALSANMLSQAKALCLGSLGPVTGAANTLFSPGAGHGVLDIKTFTTPLIRENYDAELWLRLCAIANPTPIHVLNVAGEQLVARVVDDTAHTFQGTGMIDNALYPQTGQPIGNDRGTVDPTLINCTAENIDTCNKWPWCVDDTEDYGNNMPLTQAQNEWIDANQYPRCPSGLGACGISQNANCLSAADGNRWAVRGAINAGMSVFLYVRSIENSTPPPDYNQCELLK